jgi:serine/threonine protein phosphatase 1
MAGSDVADELGPCYITCMNLGIGRSFFSGVAERPKVDPAVRIYAVGDVHGRHDLLLSMLGRIADDYESEPDERRCKIVFLGDYIDRGDNSRMVLTSLMRLMSGAPRGVTALRGNHEAALLDFIDNPLRNSAWLDFGARQTIADYGVPMPPRRPSDDDLIGLRDALAGAMGEHLDFLRTLPCHATSGDVVFTHAGLAPGDADALRDTRAMLWGHHGSEGDWPAPGKLLVHGHYDAADPVDRPGRICVDTGAYYSGRLTAVRLDDRCSFLSVGL